MVNLVLVQLLSLHFKLSAIAMLSGKVLNIFIGKVAAGNLEGGIHSHSSTMVNEKYFLDMSCLILCGIYSEMRLLCQTKRLTAC